MHRFAGVLPIFGLMALASCAGHAPSGGNSTCTVVRFEPSPPLTLLHEPDFRASICDKTKESYRITIDTFHMATQARAVRVDFFPDGHGELTVKGTDLSITDAKPSLTVDRTRRLNDAEITDFRAAVSASPIWTAQSPPWRPNCIPESMVIVEALRGGRRHEIEIGCDAVPMHALFDQFRKLQRSLDPSW